MWSEIVTGLVIGTIIFLYQWRVKSDFVFPLITISGLSMSITYNVSVIFFEEWAYYIPFVISGVIGLIVFNLLLDYYKLDYIKYEKRYILNKDLMHPKRGRKL